MKKLGVLIISYVIFLFFGIPIILCFITGDLEYLDQVFMLMFEDVINFCIELIQWIIIIFAVGLGIRLA